MAKENTRKKSDQREDHSKVTNDPRFAKIHDDPRFNIPKAKALKSDIDSRFTSALKSTQKNRKHTDKYGRKISKEDSKKDLERYYNLENSEDEEEEAKKDAESESESESEVDEEQVAIARKLDRMRGKGMSDDESSSDESDSDADAEPDVEFEEDEYTRTTDNVPQGDASKRFAVVNLDWDNVRAIDLMATFSSFAPKTGRVVNVKILPSEYGKKRMAEEELNGPPRDLFDAKTSAKDKAPVPSKTTKGGNFDDYENDEDFNSSTLRRYQLQRMQYYYAVVECDSVSTASNIYNNCDGTEFESTANFFDLRYVPDEMDFDDKPRDECSKIPNNYQPNNFETDALNHSKVRLTWDETPKERAKFVSRAFNQKEMDEMDVKAYLASDSDSDAEEAAEKYKSLLGLKGSKKDTFGAESDSEAGSGYESAGESGSDVDMEITFNPVLEGKAAKLEVLDKKKVELTDKDNISSIEKYRLKEKERRQRRMENARARKQAEQEAAEQDESKKAGEMELMMMDDDLKSEKVSSDKPTKGNKKLSKRQQKKKAMEEAEADFDVKDSRFQSLFNDADFAIDSTNPQYKKTKAMDKVVSERRRRQHDAGGEEPAIKKRKHHSKTEDVSALVANIKRKNK